MKFYEKYYASNYEELITYYPRFYRDVFEMAEILKAHGRIADGMEDSVERTYLNSFIDTADRETLDKLMDFFNIRATGTQSLIEKRGLIKMNTVGNGKISASLLKKMFAAYTDAPIDITFEPFDEEGNNRLVIDCKIPETSTFVLSDVKPIVEKKIPAHIAFLLLVTMEWDGEVYTEQQIPLVLIELHWRLPFWEYRTFDGAWIFDGSEGLDADIDYFLPAGIIFNLGAFVNLRKFDGSWDFDGNKKLNAQFIEEADLEQIEIRTQLQLTEEFLQGMEINAGSIYFWQTPLLNGEYLLDGSIKLDRKRQECSQGSLCVVGTVNTTTEEILNAEVEIKRNLWYLDGSKAFSDAGKLNAYYEKEAI